MRLKNRLQVCSQCQISGKGSLAGVIGQKSLSLAPLSGCSNPSFSLVVISVAPFKSSLSLSLWEFNQSRRVRSFPASREWLSIRVDRWNIPLHIYKSECTCVWLCVCVPYHLMCLWGCACLWILVWIWVWGSVRVQSSQLFCDWITAVRRIDVLSVLYQHPT